MLWLLTLPFRIFFGLLFGLLLLPFTLLFLPFLLLRAVFKLALLAFLIWAIVRASRPAYALRP